jgi:hypothetical protein
VLNDCFPRVFLLAIAQIRDLLIANPSSGDRLEVRSSTTAAGITVSITNLTRVVVMSAKEAMDVYDRGCAGRAVAATGIHDLSSRSHSVLTVEVAGVYVHRLAGPCKLSRVLNNVHPLSVPPFSAEGFRRHTPTSAAN